MSLLTHSDAGGSGSPAGLSSPSPVKLSRSGGGGAGASCTWVVPAGLLGGGVRVQRRTSTAAAATCAAVPRSPLSSACSSRPLPHAMSARYYKRWCSRALSIDGRTVAAATSVVACATRQHCLPAVDSADGQARGRTPHR